MMLTGCSEDFEINDNEQGLNGELLSGKYVAFAAPGATVTADPVDVEEGSSSGDDIVVEIPTGSVSDVTVNFIFSGTAVFGTDFTVPGATSAGGSVVIQHDPDAPDATNVFDHADIIVNALSDAVADGDKTLIITLTSASSADGDILVGRGGTDILRSQTVNITDADPVPVL